MSRETEKRQLRAGNFTMNNGRVLSTINLLREKYNALRSVEKAVSYEGIEKQEFVDSVNFLAEEGYIYLRDIKTREDDPLRTVIIRHWKPKSQEKASGSWAVGLLITWLILAINDGTEGEKTQHRQGGQITARTEGHCGADAPDRLHI